MYKENDLMNLLKDAKENKDQIFFRLVEVKRGIPTHDEMKHNSIDTLIMWTRSI